jgi:Fic family protein
MLPFDPSTLTPDPLDFLPPKIDSEVINGLTPLLIEARTEIAELKGYCSKLPNPMILLSTSITKESIASSEIENIHTTLVDLLQNSLFPEEDRNQADKEVLRYKDGIIRGWEYLKDGYPLTNRVILGVQGVLIPSERGIYRQNQNVIWNPSKKQVVHVPPRANEVAEFMKNWEDFANESQNSFDPLISNSILHYQFENIHPFNDGNGRTGRILMVLYLIHKGLLEYPVLFLSGYISENKNRYYEVLQNIRAKNDWFGFFEFMLTAFKLQAIETKQILFSVSELIEDTKLLLKQELPKIYNSDLVENIFMYPVVTPLALADKLGVHYTTATRYLQSLEKMGILENKKVGTYQMYTNKNLVQLLQK